MSKIRLHYWNGRGRAEPIRFALAAANLEFENAVVSEVRRFDDFAVVFSRTQFDVHRKKIWPVFERWEDSSMDSYRCWRSMGMS